METLQIFSFFNCLFQCKLNSMNNSEVSVSTSTIINTFRCISFSICNGGVTFIRFERTLKCFAVYANGEHSPFSSKQVCLFWFCLFIPFFQRTCFTLRSFTLALEPDQLFDFKQNKSTSNPDCSGPKFPVKRISQSYSIAREMDKLHRAESRSSRETRIFNPFRWIRGKNP